MRWRIALVAGNPASLGNCDRASCRFERTLCRCRESLLITIERQSLIQHLNTFRQCRAFGFYVVPHRGAQVQMAECLLRCNGIACQLGEDGARATSKGIQRFPTVV